jgi:hypothetical protein
MTHTLRCPRLGSEVFLSSLRSGFFIPLGFDIARLPAISRKLSIGLLTPVSTLGGSIVPPLRSVQDVQRLGLSIVPLFRRVQVISAPMVRGSARRARKRVTSRWRLSKTFLVYSINGMR